MEVEIDKIAFSTSENMCNYGGGNRQTTHLHLRMTSTFIGRELELQRLMETTHKRTASFIVVRGRRRVGKSRLIQEFSKQFSHYYVFSGLPPKKDTTAKEQLNEFSRQMAQQFRRDPVEYQDWSDALWMVGELLQTGKVLLFFDEISWMGSKDPNFMGKIKNLWDLQLKNNNRLVFVVCGSASAWIEENLLSSTGFVGRVSFTLTLDELPLPDCNRFWPAEISAYEKFKFLSVTGGIPRYLEELDATRSAEENIRRLCFTSGGLLVDEFKQITSDIFLRESDNYRKILKILCSGPREMSDISKQLTGDHRGRVGEYLHELQLSGFVARDYAWNLKSGDDSKRSTFRLRDNYFRFYLKYIEKNLGRIDRGDYTLKSLTSLPDWFGIMGLQFQNLVANNRRQLYQALRIRPGDLVNGNPFFQSKTARHGACQIDYLIQTRFDTLYVCEVKLSRNEVGSRVIDEVREKISALARPRGMSCRPVLIHVNGVSEELTDSGYFSDIIDMGQLLSRDVS